MSEQTKAEEWREKYNAHLQSPEWRSLCALVHRRAGGTCEGCGINRSTQVHHLTYKHLGNEFLWELRAVCGPCHNRGLNQPCPWGQAAANHRAREAHAALAAREPVEGRDFERMPEGDRG